MHEFGHELDRAMDAYIDKHCGSDCSHDCSEETETKILELLKQEEKTMKNQNKRMTRWIGVIAACAVLMCSAVVVYAASPAVREYLNMLFLKEDSVQRLTEVPEGYTPIRTAEDLDRVRENLTGNYILMNDIVLTEEDYKEGGVFEGGFVPIGNEAEPYQGIFNGNGYAVSGLVINGDYKYAGLFGYVKWGYKHIFTEEYDPEREWGPNGEITGYTRTITGIVKNLGVVDSVISVQCEDVPAAQVGGIAGHGDFVVGCFTDNTEITLDLGENPNEGTFAVGGVVGAGFMIDSCYSGADITVISARDITEVYTAGVAGQSYACITSYFSGTIDCGDYTDYGVTSTYDLIVPFVLSEDIFDELTRRHIALEAEAAGVEPSEIQHSWEMQKLRAFYVQFHYSNLDEEFRFFIKNMEDHQILMLDPETKPREQRMLSTVIEKVFPDNTFNQFCMENNLKCGYYYCYDLREMTDCTFEGFDTESIWYMADGKPRLRLFSGGTKELTIKSVSERPRLGWQKGLFQVPIPGME